MGPPVRHFVNAWCVVAGMSPSCQGIGEVTDKYHKVPQLKADVRPNESK